MSDAAIYNAFCLAVSEFAAQHVPPVPVAFPGVPMNPPGDDGLWLEVQWFPNASSNYGLSDDGPTLLQGFGQVGVCCQPGRGMMAAESLSDAVIAAFRKGTMIDRVKVDAKPSKASMIDDAARSMIPVTIPYRGFDN